MLLDYKKNFKKTNFILKTISFLMLAAILYRNKKALMLIRRHFIWSHVMGWACFPLPSYCHSLSKV